MQFKPEKYRIPDVPLQPFIDECEIWDYINNTISTPIKVKEVVEKSLAKNRLSLEETAILINANDAESVQILKNGAKELKKRIYGNRIVELLTLFGQIVKG